MFSLSVPLNKARVKSVLANYESLASYFHDFYISKLVTEIQSNLFMENKCTPATCKMHLSINGTVKSYIITIKMGINQINYR